METTIKTTATEARIIARIEELARDGGIALELERASFGYWNVRMNGVSYLLTLEDAEDVLREEVFGELDRNWSPFED